VAGIMPRDFAVISSAVDYLQPFDVNEASKIGRDDWIRTSDPLTPSQVRYQAAPHPEIFLSAGAH
jgi:hypothetical protein